MPNIALVYLDALAAAAAVVVLVLGTELEVPEGHDLERDAVRAVHERDEALAHGAPEGGGDMHTLG
jgi:hypothetical protein